MQTSEFLVEIKNADPQEVLLLPIGPDQKYYNNKMFSELLGYINEHNLNVEMVVADTLRRFTCQMSGQNEKSALEFSQQLGIGWEEKNLDGNKEKYEALKAKNKVKVTHWDEFKGKHEEKFNLLHGILTSLYENVESGFHRTVETAKSTFCRLFGEKNQSNPVYNKSKAESLSVKYILEECAVTLLWRLLGYKQMAYPASQNPINDKIFNCLRTVVKEIEKNPEFDKILNFKETQMEQRDISIKSINTENKKNNNELSTKNSNQPRATRKQQCSSAPSRLEDNFIKYEGDQIIEKETRSKSEHSSPRNSSPEKYPRPLGGQGFFERQFDLDKVMDMVSTKDYDTKRAFFDSLLDRVGFPGQTKIIDQDHSDIMTYSNTAF